MRIAFTGRISDRLSDLNSQVPKAVNITTGEIAVVYAGSWKPMKK
jgi:hypothetical protein